MLKDFARYLLLKWFKRKYNRTKVVASYFSDSITGFYSQAGQDAFVYTEFFSMINDGRISKVFLDIGCNHPTKFSNSYFFEKNLGFECIAVDPLPTYLNAWKSSRSNSIFNNVALGSSTGELSLSVPDQTWDSEKNSHPPDMFSTMDKANPRLTEGKWKTINVPVVTAKDLLDSLNISKIGIASIDVEGFEMQVLKGFDFNSTRIDICIIENNTNSKFGSEDIRKFMMSNGYVFYARIWGLDDIFILSELMD